MGIYSNVLFPWAYDRLAKRLHLDERRATQLSSATGRVLELGIGTGLNLPFYPESVREIFAIDPNPGMKKQLVKKLRSSAVRVHLVQAPAERLPFADSRFDSVITTLVLCSIPDLARALAEVRRVLTPNGQFLFLEHGASPDAKVAKWQKRLNWIQRRIGAGCRLDVPVSEALATAGFRFAKLERYYLEGDPKTHGYIYEGTAILAP